MNTQIAPTGNGVFPIVPHNQLVSLSLGNGSRFDVMISPLSGNSGLFVAVQTCGRNGGCYPFSFPPAPGYLMEKLRLLEGDANHFADFIACQFGQPENPPHGEYDIPRTQAEKEAFALLERERVRDGLGSEPTSMREVRDFLKRIPGSSAETI